MLYDELHQRYGNHIAKRVQIELAPAEFKQVMVKELPNYLEHRAEAAHKKYQTWLDNPFSSNKLAVHDKHIDALYRRWREAEDLAYLINVAEDVGANARQVTAVGHVTV